MTFKSSAYAAAAAVALFGATAILDAAPASARCRSLVRGEHGARHPADVHRDLGAIASGARPCGRATAAAITRWGCGHGTRTSTARRASRAARWHCRASARACDGAANSAPDGAQLCWPASKIVLLRRPRVLLGPKPLGQRRRPAVARRRQCSASDSVSTKSLWTVSRRVPISHEVGPTIRQAAAQTAAQADKTTQGGSCVRHGSASGIARRHPASGADALLSVRDVSVRFGGIVALDGVSFDVAPGQIAGLIGPNGAGKTTLFNCLSRLYMPNDGDILFEGRSILDRPRHAIPQIGIGRTFQNVALFDRMSVLDNVKVGCHSRTLDGLPRPTRCACRRSRARGARASPSAPQELIAFMDLEPFAHRAGRRPAVPDPQARRAGPRARRQPQAAAARRAGRRPQPRRGRRAAAARSGACATRSTSPCCWSSTT